MKLGNKQLHFFFTPEELVKVITEFETSCAAFYYRTGTFPSQTISAISSLAGEPLLGYLTTGDWNYSPSYLIAAPNTNILVREIKLRKGGYSFAVDQEENPDTVVFKPSGIFTEEILIAGSLETIATTTYSVRTFQLFARIIKKHTSRIGVFYVGPDARKKLTLGWRLATNISSPKMYDLRLE